MCKAVNIIFNQYFVLYSCVNFKFNSELHLMSLFHGKSEKRIISRNAVIFINSGMLFPRRFNASNFYDLCTMIIVLSKPISDLALMYDL